MGNVELHIVHLISLYVCC